MYYGGIGHFFLFVFASWSSLLPDVFMFFEVAGPWVDVAVLLTLSTLWLLNYLQCLLLNEFGCCFGRMQAVVYISSSCKWQPCFPSPCTVWKLRVIRQRSDVLLLCVPLIIWSYDFIPELSVVGTGQFWHNNTLHKGGSALWAWICCRRVFGMCHNEGFYQGILVLLCCDSP